MSVEHYGYMFMKRICLLALLVCPLLFGACNDVPRYASDSIVAGAKSLSPDCPAPVESKGG